MTLITQPPGSRLCGQACVAMVTGRSMNSVCGQLGSKGTRTRDLARVLRQHGFRVKDRLTRCRAIVGYPGVSLTARALVKESLPGKRNWHWVLWWDGVMYDPDPDGPQGKLTSYLDLTL